MPDKNDTPYGYCHCGCGEKTTIARYTASNGECVKGEPRKYLKNHRGRCATTPPPNPSGKCFCGCGEVTRIAKSSIYSAGWVSGEHVPYIRGHATRKSAREYVREDRGYDTECWIWARYCDRGGYGKMGRDYAHRVYYRGRFGDIPEGLEIDHLCHVPSCVNPEHLEAVTHAENMRRRFEREASEKRGAA